MIKFQVSVDDGAGDALKALIGGLSGSLKVELNEVGGRGAMNAAIQFHKEFDAKGGWRGHRSFGTGASSFGADIWQGWFFKAADPDGAVIANGADHYRFKVTGGTIRPKRVENLTLPIAPEAHGLRVKDFEHRYGKVFRPRGKKVLMQKGKNKGDKPRTIYALVKQVTQEPWPDAVPPEEVITDGFMEGFNGALRDMIDSL